MLYIYNKSVNNNPAANSLELKSFREAFSQGKLHWIETRFFETLKFAGYRINYAYPETNKKIQKFLEKERAWAKIKGKKRPGALRFAKILNPNLHNNVPTFTFEGILLFGNIQRDVSL